MYKSHNMAIVCLLIVLMTGCATPTYYGDGTVVKMQKIGGKDYKPHQGALAGVKLGGAVGVVSGAVYGGLLGAGLSLLSENPMPYFILAGAGIGGVAGGIAGGTIGGTTGYAIDVTSPNSGLYEYKVKTDKDHNVLSIKQYSSPLPVNTQVKILERNSMLYIQKK